MLRFPRQHSTMAWFYNTSARKVFVLLSVLAAGWAWDKCEGSAIFGFDTHHVLSDPVKGMLGLDGLLPEKNSLEYYQFLAQTDRLIRGRRLDSNNLQTPLTFLYGNSTFKLALLGYLHYANVSVGTPAKSYLVALDTASSLFWLPCDCGKTCLRDLEEIIGQSVPLPIYSANASTTSSGVGCSDARCFQADQCSSPRASCPYQIKYVIHNSSSSGNLVQDVLHLVTDDEQVKPMEANITLGCGRVLTGTFQKREAVNGLLGLGLEDYSVPSLLAKQGIASNSFSMCFGLNNIRGRISFGDKGNSDQLETPFLVTKSNPTYSVNVTHIKVGAKAMDVGFPALFHTGMAFTYLAEPAYTALTKSFNALVKDKRLPLDPNFPFEYCYQLSLNRTIVFPKIDLTMSGNNSFSLRNPLFIALKGGEAMYCLAVLPSAGFKLNIIGQNFMAGYRIVFDRERMVLGWTNSDCFGDSLASTPESPAPAPAPAPESSSPPPSLSPTLPPPIPSVSRNASNVTPNNKGSSPRLHHNLLVSSILLFLPILAPF